MDRLSGNFTIAGASRRFEQFCRDEQGATAIEYGLIAAGIFLAIIVPVASIGDGVLAAFTDIAAGF
jgi:pilus assembly protein Flp/PilA